MEDAFEHYKALEERHPGVFEFMHSFHSVASSRLRFRLKGFRGFEDFAKAATAEGLSVEEVLSLWHANEWHEENGPKR